MAGKKVVQEGPRRLFSPAREACYLAFFIFWICIDVSLLGLVSEQIHKYGRETGSYPSAEYYHVLGLLLFATILGLIYGIFHYALNLPMTIFILMMFGVFYGTGAGVIQATPFGHALACRSSVPDTHFPAAWIPFRHECGRIVAIEGLAWIMFALAVFLFFWTFFDTFSVTMKRSVMYDTLAERGERKEAEAEAKEKAKKEQA